MTRRLQPATKRHPISGDEYVIVRDTRGRKVIVRCESCAKQQPLAHAEKTFLVGCLHCDHPTATYA